MEVYKMDIEILKEITKGKSNKEIADIFDSIEE